MGKSVKGGEESSQERKRGPLNIRPHRSPVKRNKRSAVRSSPSDLLLQLPSSSSVSFRSINPIEGEGLLFSGRCVKKKKQKSVTLLELIL